MKIRTDVRLMFTMVLLAVLLSSCAAVNPGVPPSIADFQAFVARSGAVIKGVTRALSGSPGTEILRKGEQYLFLWSSESTGAVAFFGIDLKTSRVIDVIRTIRKGGQFVNCKTARDVVDFVKSSGWQSIPATSVPVIVRYTVALLSLPVNATVNIPVIVLPGSTLDTLEDLMDPFPAEVQS